MRWRSKAQHQLISLLLDLLHDSVPERAINLTMHATDVVRRSEAIVLASSDEPVTVLDLCQQLRQPPHPAKQFSADCRHHAGGLSALLRLNAVRRMLPSSAMPGLACDAPGTGALYHGHFARDYRKLFTSCHRKPASVACCSKRVAVSNAHTGSMPLAVGTGLTAGFTQKSGKNDRFTH
jgi:hypothetical protein